MGVMTRGKDVLDAIDQSPSLRVKSSLQTWMRANHDAFAERLSERIADWEVLSKLFAAGGLTDRYGNPPKPETARKTWQRVRGEVAKEKAKQLSRRPDPVKTEPTKPIETDRPAAAPLASTGADDILSRMSNPGRRMPDPIS
jgi:hypothetical protein